MEGMLREWRVTARALAGSPGLVVVAVLTLALGIGANTAIFSVINGSLLAPLPYQDPEGLVWLSDGHENFGGAGVDQSLPNLEDLRDGSRLMSAAAIYDMASGNLATAEHPERVGVMRVTSEMLSVLGVSPALGRDFLPEEDLAGSARVAILTDAVWQARFGGDPGVVGRTTTVDAEPVEVVGILPRDFFFPGDPDLLTPLQHVGAETPRGNRRYHAVGRLAPGAELESLRQELQGMFDRLVETYPDENGGWFTWAEPMRDFVTGRNRQALYLLAGGVVLVLLIACVNVANLLIVRTERRHREFAVRHALGADRWSLLPHFLGEGVTLALAGGVAGVATAYWGVDLLVALFGDSLRRPDQIALNGTVLAFTLITSVGVGLVVGVVPMIRLGRVELREGLREGGRGASDRGSRLGRGLVVAEVALAVLLVSGAGLLSNSLWRLQRVDLGVADPERVLTFQLSLPAAKYAAPDEMAAFYDALVADIDRMPGVQAVGLVNRLPLLGGYNTTNFPVVGDPERVAHFVSIRSVTSGYFDAVGLPLLQGRWLDPAEFRDDGTVSVLINQTLARQLFGSEDPLGQRVGPRWVEGGLMVVGVVGDLAGGDPTLPPPPAFYFPRVANPNRNMSALVRVAGDPHALLPAIRQTVARLDPEIPVFRERTLEEIARSRLGTRWFAMSLFGVFAGLALALGAVGIYGVMAAAVTQRTRELGVRLALGASRGTVLRMVLGQGLKLVLPGVALGLLLSASVSRLMGSLLYGVSPLDPTTYALVAATLTVVAMGASGVPATRAARVDPNTSMRSE